MPPTGGSTSRPSRRRSTTCGPRSRSSWTRKTGSRSTGTSMAARSIRADFAQDWNRSFVLEPDGAPVGAVVFLHGLTDAPYSQRHIARRYREHGYVAIGIRLPAHGTVPAALSEVEWEDWMAATRLAVREARRRIGPSLPLHLVGFSNGGALAMKYALDAIEDQELGRPDRLVLISPMIGITAFARFAGIRRPAGAPAEVREGRLAQHPARIQPVQVQLVPDQRRAPVMAAHAGAAGADPAAGAQRPAGRACRRSSPSSRSSTSRSARARSSPHCTCICPPTAASSCCST